jgi:hypothetical protein
LSLTLTKSISSVSNWILPPELHNNGKIRHWNFNFVVERFAYYRPNPTLSSFLFAQLTLWRRYALDSSFSIYVFIGNFPEDSRLWDHEPHLVLASGILTSSRPSGTEQETCSNCARQAAAKCLYRDFVPMTKMLVDYVRSGEVQPPAPTEGLRLRSLEPEDVVPFLKKNMHWRIVGVSFSPHSIPR